MSPVPPSTDSGWRYAPAKDCMALLLDQGTLCAILPSPEIHLPQHSIKRSFRSQVWLPSCRSRDRCMSSYRPYMILDLCSQKWDSQNKGRKCKIISISLGKIYIDAFLKPIIGHSPNETWPVLSSIPLMKGKFKGYLTLLLTTVTCSLPHVHVICSATSKDESQVEQPLFIHHWEERRFVEYTRQALVD